MIDVHLEIMPWLSRYFPSEGSGRVVMEKTVQDGTTVGDLLEALTAHNPEFRKVLFDTGTGRVVGYISVILNDRFLELAGGMEALLKPGDTVRLMPGFSGG